MSNCIANLPKEDATKMLIHSGKINRHWQELKLNGYSRKLFMDIFVDINKMIDYCLWYERKDEKLNRVDEDEVNKYLSELEYETQ